MKEILIIKTDNSAKIKNLLDREQINYQLVYDDILYDKGLKEEEVWSRDIRLANQDRQRNKEIAEWDAISDEDEWENIKDDEWN
ncbi:MAG: hypothetical protein I3273_04320 [Candidatus Moeniiplasma glomeromycotorum]|nr:hypothetical protein [Candidatus Moeniiplasma glomeromycotorum]MCE8169321.1 hypothetical protein [Candidatus Moeniiplasma glomeromycotorum]